MAIQSLSPEETSRWCSSLAPCGIQGGLLSGLQAAIVRQHVDAKRFDELLKSNALHDLHVDGLNPRLTVAIRRAWNKDFEKTRFIPHTVTEPQGAAARRAVEPPPYSQRVRSGGKRAESQGSLVTADAYNAANLACRLKEPSPSDFYAKSFDNHVMAKCPAPTSYAAPEMHSKPSQSNRQSSLVDNSGGGIGDIFAPKPPAQTSYAPPEMHVKPTQSQRRSFSRENSKGDLANIFAPKPAAPKTFSPSENLCQIVRPNSRTSAGDGAGNNLGHIFAAKPPAPRTFAQPDMHGKPEPLKGQSVLAENSAGGLGDVFAPKPPASRTFTSHRAASDAPVEHRSARHHVDNGWDGISFGDALAQPKPAQNRFGASEQTEPETPASKASAGRRRPANDGWEGMSLGDAMAPSKPSQNRFGAPLLPEGEAVSSRATSRRGRSDNNSWEGVSLGDALGPRQPVRHTYAAVDSCSHQGGLPQSSKSPSACGGAAISAQHDDPWDGASLADAMGKKPLASPAPSQAPVAPIDWSKEPRRGGRRDGAGASANNSSDKSPNQIIEWLKTLPESHVPEKTREELCSIVEGNGFDGNAFTSYVQTVPPDVCAPKHAMKLKAAWKNVLAEAEMRAAAQQNHAANSSQCQKAVALKL